MAKTVRKVCEYALRKIFGVDETPTAPHMTDALERLDDMLAFWAATGATTGVVLPLSFGDVLSCPDSYIPAIQDNLIIALADLYDRALPPQVVFSARVGVQHVKASSLPAVREPADSIDFIPSGIWDYGEATTPPVVPPIPPVVSEFSMDFSVPANSGYLAALDL